MAEWGEYTKAWKKKAKGNGVSLNTFSYRRRQGYTEEEAATPGKIPNKRPFDRPEFFTFEWYEQQKAEGKTDTALSKELFVSLNVLVRWKKEVVSYIMVKKV